MSARIAVVIPAWNEEATIGDVVRGVLASADAAVIVVDNGSSDATAERALKAGATVVNQPARGYGRACMAGAAAALNDAEVLVFMDGDGSDRCEDIPALLTRIDGGDALVLGVRKGAAVEAGSIAPAARFGNWLSGLLIGLFWGRRIHDLSPLKAIRADAYRALQLREQTYGWTIELITSALSARMQVAEVPVGYRKRRGGVSKVSGNLGASTRAGYRILLTIARVRSRTLPRAVRGSLAGALAGTTLLVVLAWWLLLRAAASPRVLVTVCLVAWPLLITTIGLGALGSRLVPGRNREEVRR